MRKRYKNKRRSCALCKPHKRGRDLRWRPRELADLERAERELAAHRGIRPSESRL
ncbi:MAG: hypothetical protein ACLGH6_14455 [Gammaproteobacteria bacterium]